MLKKEDDFIENLNTVRRINTSFVIASATIKTARNGKDYLEFSLTDKTGEIIARMFPNRDAQEIFENINQKSIYHVTGNVDEFPRNSQNFSIKIDSFQALDEDDYTLMILSEPVIKILKNSSGRLKLQLGIWKILT
jgi:3'-5' exoribonuclease